MLANGKIYEINPFVSIVFDSLQNYILLVRFSDRNSWGVNRNNRRFLLHLHQVFDSLFGISSLLFSIQTLEKVPWSPLFRNSWSFCLPDHEYVHFSSAFVFDFRVDWVNSVASRVVFAMNLIHLVKCQMHPNDPRCENLNLSKKLSFIKYLRNILAPIPRVYYGVAEGIFLVMLFRTLKDIKRAPELGKLMRLRAIQTIFFVLDLLFTITMMVCLITALFEPVALYDYIGMYT